MSTKTAAPNICGFIETVYLRQRNVKDAFKDVFSASTRDLGLAPPVLVTVSEAVGMGFGPVTIRPWGLPALPKCPMCQPELVQMAPVPKTGVKHAKSRSKGVKVVCPICKTVGNAERPRSVENTNVQNVFIFPFPPPLPEFRPVMFVDAEGEVYANGQKRGLEFC